MKKLIYQIEGYSSVYNPETEEVERHLSLANVIVKNPTEADIAKAKEFAYNGEYTIADDGIKEQILAPRNILAEEYITLNGVLYKATENIPNGEPIIVGQNAIETTVEKQLYELKGE